MSARVEATLPGGRFHVRVDDLLLEMNLPDGFKAGDRIELQFVSAQPRPSFILNSEPEPAPARAQVQLSGAGRALGDILKSIEPEKQTQAAIVKAAAPLLQSPSTEAPKLAEALSKALSTSGVFYESHQSQWVQGQRPVQDLLSEPQGKLSPALRGDVPGGSSAADPATLDKMDGKSLSVSGNVSSSEASPSDRSAPTASPVHQDALPQVRSQLHALETQQLVWQGQLWPGQDMEWTIRDPGEESGPAGEVSPWFTQLRLRLPQLGALTADLALVDRALRVRLTAGNAESQAQMDAAYSSLANALAAAGIDLISFKVTGDGD
jgi:hypothetical protein